MKSDWIVIANATHARVLEHEPGAAMNVLASFNHPAGRRKTSELAGDRMGAERNDRAFGGAAFQPRLDPKEREHRRFARELAQYLESAAAGGRFRALAIFASSPFLGELKGTLGAATYRRLQSTRDLDLTSFGLQQVQEHVLREFSV